MTNVASAYKSKQREMMIIMYKMSTYGSPEQNLCTCTQRKTHFLIVVNIVNTSYSTQTIPGGGIYTNV